MKIYLRSNLHKMFYFLRNQHSEDFRSHLEFGNKVLINLRIGEHISSDESELENVIIYFIERNLFCENHQILAIDYR